MAWNSPYPGLPNTNGGARRVAVLVVLNTLVNEPATPTKSPSELGGPAGNVTALKWIVNIALSMSLLAPDVVDDELYDWLPEMNEACVVLSKPDVAARKANVS